MKLRGYAESTIKKISKRLVYLSKFSNLDNPDSPKQHIMFKQPEIFKQKILEMDRIYENNIESKSLKFKLSIRTKTSAHSKETSSQDN